MPPRDAFRVEPDFAPWIAPDDCLSFGNDHRPAVDRKPESCPLGWHTAIVAGVDHVTGKRIPNPVHGSDQPGVGGRIREGATDLPNQYGEVGFDDVSVRPKSRLKLVLGHDVRPMFDQHAQKIERLDGEVHLAVGGEKLPAVGIEGEAAKEDFHKALSGGLTTAAKAPVVRRSFSEGGRRAPTKNLYFS